MSIRFIAALIAGSSASLASAQTFTWTGLAGTELWSTPANWSTNSVPTSLQTSTIDFATFDVTEPFGTFLAHNDLGEGFDVGTLQLGRTFIAGGSIHVHHSVSAANSLSYGFPPSDAKIELVGDVPLTSTRPAAAPLSSANSVTQIRRLSGDGLATFIGGWRVDNLDVAGINIPANGSLMAYGAPLNLASLSVAGVFDIQGTINMAPGHIADLSAGVVDLGQNNNTAGGPAIGRVSFNGDVKLGRWAIGGGYTSGGAGTIDRIDATGTLDLRFSDVLDMPFEAYAYEIRPLPAFLVLASYGNRIGSLDVQEILLSVNPFGQGPPRTAFPIVYTSAENAGPGEIRIMLPEPSSLLILALASAVTRRRR